MLTLKELKNMTEIPASGQKTPTAKELRASAEPVAEHILRGDAGIIAYKSGYAVYSVCGAATVFCIHSCGGYCYDSGENPCGIGSGLFDGEAWYLRLVLEGEDRLCRNREAREQDWSISYSSVSEEWGRLDSGGEPVLNRIIREETVEGFLSVLSDRQRQAVSLFYLEQKSERQIAGELGITAPAVSKILSKSVNRMRQSGLIGKTVLSGSLA